MTDHTPSGLPQPQRPPLTHEQIYKLCGVEDRDAMMKNMAVYCARAVEAALSAPAVETVAVQPLERAFQWGRLYDTANALAARLGYEGAIDTSASEVDSFMDALHDLDGGQSMPGLTPAQVALPAAPKAEPTHAGAAMAHFVSQLARAFKAEESQ